MLMVRTVPSGAGRPHHPREWLAARAPGRSVEFSVVGAVLFDRAGDLKRELVEFSQQERYERAAGQIVAQFGDGSEAFDKHRLLMLWDYFVLEHKLSDGRTAVEQFADARPSCPRPSGRCRSGGGTRCRGRSRCNCVTGWLSSTWRMS